MGKYITSLVVVGLSLIPGAVGGSEQTRRVQEELHKRHLFYSDQDGKSSATLTAAIRRFQERQGFEPTGIPNSETLDSLGVRPAPVANTGSPVAPYGRDIRDANGELVPGAPPLGVGYIEDFDLTSVGATYIERDLTPYQRGRQRKDDLDGEKGALFNDVYDTNTPVRGGFELTVEPIDLIAVGAAWNPSILPRQDDWRWQTIDQQNDRSQQIAADMPKRRHLRAVHHTARRKDTNPIIMAFQTVDRLMRNVFADAPAKRHAVPAWRR